MTKLLESDILKKYLEVYMDNKLDLSNPKHQHFLENMAGAILLLIPESVNFMVDEGIPEDDTIIYAAMAAIGKAIGEVGEINLKKKGVNYEDNESNLRLVSNGPGRVLN